MMIGALSKRAVGKVLYERMNLDALVNPKRAIDVDERIALFEKRGTHPYLANRIHAVEEFVRSDCHRNLMGSE